jgi:hypothetical protein
MKPLMIRQLWQLVESSPATALLRLDDASLVQSLLHQYDYRQPLNAEETSLLSTYIRARLALIRDLAEERTISAVQ